MFPKSIYPQKPTNNGCRISLLVLLSLCFIPLTAIANNRTERENADINTTVLFQPPPEEEQPAETEGAASRQNRVCPQDFLAQQPAAHSDRHKLTAIVPERNYGLTVAERPTFWFYLPRTSAQQAILTIKEEGTNPHWQQSVNLPEKTGIMGIKLSDAAPILETSTNYQWALILVCGTRPNPNDPVVTAWIKRADKSQVIKKQQLAPTGLEKAAMYAQQGIWYDALDMLVAEKKSSLDNWNALWLGYLQSGGLAEIAHEPVISDR